MPTLSGSTINLQNKLLCMIKMLFINSFNQQTKNNWYLLSYFTLVTLFLLLYYIFSLLPTILSLYWVTIDILVLIIRIFTSLLTHGQFSKPHTLMSASSTYGKPFFPSCLLLTIHHPDVHFHIPQRMSDGASEAQNKCLPFCSLLTRHPL